MILGVDHVALSTADVVGMASALTRDGFTLAFHDPLLPNHPHKKPVLQDYRPTHQIAFLQASRGIAVELTQHAAELTRRSSSFQVVFQGQSADLWEDHPWPNAAGWGDVLTQLSVPGARPGWMPALQAQGWLVPTSDTGLSIRLVMAAVDDLETAQAFWARGLGMSVVAQRHDHTPAFVHLAFRRPVPAWSLDFVLVHESTAAPAPHLDDSGFPCLALLTSSLSADLARALAAGGRPAVEPFGLVVNQKRLTVALIRAPSGHLVELIEIHRGT